MTSNSEQAHFWSQMAPTWLELEEQMEEITGPAGLMAMERLSPRPGHRVVDLGCGPGRTTIDLALRVEPDGTVTGVDIAPEMVEGARERADALGVTNVEFIAADVQSFELGEHRFDSAFSRFGVMFFDDPVAAFKNVRRSIRQGGALSFVCWQDVFHNEWMLVPGAAARSIVGDLPRPVRRNPVRSRSPIRCECVASSKARVSTKCRSTPATMW